MFDVNLICYYNNIGFFRTGYLTNGLHNIEKMFFTGHFRVSFRYVELVYLFIYLRRKVIIYTMQWPHVSRLVALTHLYFLGLLSSTYWKFNRHCMKNMNQNKFYLIRTFLVHIISILSNKCETWILSVVVPSSPTFKERPIISYF